MRLREFMERNKVVIVLLVEVRILAFRADIIERIYRNKDCIGMVMNEVVKSVNKSFVYSDCLVCEMEIRGHLVCHLHRS